MSELCPEKFSEILDALRETVSAHEILRRDHWGPVTPALGSMEGDKS